MSERMIVTIWGIAIFIILIVVISTAWGHGDGCVIERHTLTHINEQEQKSKFGLANAKHVHGFFDSNGSGYAIEAPGPLRSDCIPENQDSNASTRITTNKESDIREPAPSLANQEATDRETAPCAEGWYQHFFYRGDTYFLSRRIPQGAKTLGDVAKLIISGYGDSFSFHHNAHGWIKYHKGHATYPLLRHAGLRVDRSEAGNLERVIGCEIENATEIALAAGDNFIGFYTVPPRYQRIDDLLAHDQITAVHTHKFGYSSDSDFELITESSDTKIKAGYPLLITAIAPIILRLSDVPSAPSVYRKLTTSWATLKKDR